MCLVTSAAKIRIAADPHCSALRAAGEGPPMNDTNDVVRVIYNDAHASVQWQDSAIKAKCKEVG